MENFSKTELENEKWKDIEGYDGMYQVSDLGRVRSKKYGRWKVLRPRNHRSGYLRVGLYRYGKQKNVLVHRLVANAFIPNDNIFNDQINHKNEIKTDNRATNLEWCDRSYNVTYNGLQQKRMANYHRSNYRRNAIKENLELFKSNGVECCEWTVKQLRKDLGLIKK